LVLMCDLGGKAVLAEAPEEACAHAERELALRWVDDEARHEGDGVILHAHAPTEPEAGGELMLAPPGAPCVANPGDEAELLFPGVQAQMTAEHEVHRIGGAGLTAHAYADAGGDAQGRALVGSAAGVPAHPAHARELRQVRRRRKKLRVGEDDALD